MSMNNQQQTVQDSITNFCALYQDEMVLEKGYKNKIDAFKGEESQHKQTLEQFLRDENKSCVPVTVKNNDGNELQYFLRFKSRTSKKSVTEEAFRNVIEQLPTEESLRDLLNVIKDTSKLSLVDLYVLWLTKTLEKQNTTTKTIFEFTPTGEKKSKSEGGGKERGSRKKSKTCGNNNDIPEDIVAAANHLYMIQTNKKQLTSFKKEKLVELETEKKQYHKVLDKFLSAKPVEHQEQKLSMNIQGETRPFFLKKKPSRESYVTLTFAKSKPVVSSCVKNTFKTSKLSPVFFQPLDVSVDSIDRMLYELQNTPDFLNMLMSEFRQQVQQFKSSNSKITTSIVLEECRKRSKKTKSTKKDNNNNENGDENGDEEDNGRYNHDDGDNDNDDDDDDDDNGDDRD